jgi:hypothetical protein
LVSYGSPIINRQKPQKEYYLDKPSELKAIGLDPQDKDEKADKYVHYSWCDWQLLNGKAQQSQKQSDKSERHVKDLIKLKNQFTY